MNEQCEPCRESMPWERVALAACRLAHAATTSPHHHLPTLNSNVKTNAYVTGTKGYANDTQTS